MPDVRQDILDERRMTAVLKDKGRMTASLKDEGQKKREKRKKPNQNYKPIA